jgi:signal transduction histidine kinase
MPDMAQSQAYEFILRTTADGVLITSPDGLVEHVNPAAAAMLDIAPSTVEGTLIHESLRAYTILVELARSRDEMIREIKLPRRRLAVGIASTMSDQNRIILLQDITEKSSLESRREALISTMSHDLRNPISAIGGYAELVGQFGELNEQQQRFITRIRQTASKIYDVAAPLVDLAWIEAGMPLAHLPVRLHEIIYRTVRELDSLAARQNVTIAVSVQSPLPPLSGDPERIALVVHHLLQNAILYSHPDQSVAIHAWGDDHTIYCSVADQGIGIAEDELPFIFDRLYRSRDERVRNTSGGGIGLTIARTIVRRHGGAIWAVSTLGAGSTFTFILPTISG